MSGRFVDRKDRTHSNSQKPMYTVCPAICMADTGDFQKAPQYTTNTIQAAWEALGSETEKELCR